LTSKTIGRKLADNGKQLADMENNWPTIGRKWKKKEKKKKKN
jgi:hypothetical protein